MVWDVYKFIYTSYQQHHVYMWVQKDGCRRHLNILLLVNGENKLCGNNKEKEKEEEEDHNSEID